jgi:hypothetical protein
MPRDKASLATTRQPHSSNGAYYAEIQPEGKWFSVRTGITDVGDISAPDVAQVSNLLYRSASSLPPLENPKDFRVVTRPADWKSASRQ